MRIRRVTCVLFFVAAGMGPLAAEGSHVPAALDIAPPRLPPGGPPGSPRRPPDMPAMPMRPRVCFNPVETREKITAHRLSEPFRLLRGAAGRVQGEALRVRLCRSDEEFFYDIAVLRRDGHLVHVFLNAVNGQAVGALNDK